MKWLIPQKVRDLFKKLLMSNSSATEVADGLAIGMFIAFLPTIGMQMTLAFALTKMFRKNCLVAMLAVWITNPVTNVPIYILSIWIGNFFYRNPVSVYEIYDVVKNFNLEDVFTLGKDILIPLWIGSAILGVVMALISQKLCLLYYDRLKLKMLKRWYEQKHEHKSPEG